MTTTSHYPPDQGILKANDPLRMNNGHPPTRAPALMTATGLEELQGELERLRHRVRQEIAQRLHDARSYGNGSNNDEYHAIVEEQMVLSARIAMLDEIVGRAVVMDPDQAGEGVAAIGATVLIEDLVSGGEHRYRLAGAHALDPGVISAASPMGQALIGAVAGDVVTLDLPNGGSRSVRLLAVEAAAGANASPRAAPSPASG